MNIAIDCRVLTRPKTGIGISLEKILNKLQEIDKENKYYLISPKNFDYEIKNTNFKKIIAKGIFGFFGTFWLQFDVPRIIKDLNINIFWAHEHTLPLLIPKNIKKLLTIHDLTYIYYPKSMTKVNYLMNKLFVPLSIKKSDVIFADSESTKKTIISNFKGINENKIVVNYFASRFENEKIDIIYNFKDKYYIKGDYLLFVGSIEPRKNLITLLKAFIELKRKDLNLVIVGSVSWKNKEFKEFIKANPEIALRIKVFSEISVADLYHFYKNSSIFIMPSIFEGFGLPILEAFKALAPVISSNVSSLTEVGGNAVLYFDPANYHELKEKIELLLSDKSLRNELIEKGKIKVNEFSWEKAARRVLGEICIQ